MKTQDLTDYELYSVTYDSDLHLGTYKECVEIRKNINECNKDMGLSKEIMKIRKVQYENVFVVRRND